MILAALATIPGREAALEQALASLRPQVDRLHVMANGFTEPPAAAARYADVVICDPTGKLGSAAKLNWARSWVGLYLACDDDFIYPPTYAQDMLRAVQRWKGRALVAASGRVIADGTFLGATAAWHINAETPGAWVNYPGGATMAFDTRLKIPNRLPTLNEEEADLAVHCQRAGIPIWLAKHGPDRFRWLLDGAEGRTLWAEAKAEQFARRNAVLSTIRHWRVSTCR
jgi:hypothetical protein